MKSHGQFVPTILGVWLLLTPPSALAAVVLIPPEVRDGQITVEFVGGDSNISYELQFTETLDAAFTVLVRGLPGQSKFVFIPRSEKSGYFRVAEAAYPIQLDFDLDGVTNALEKSRGLDPYSWDSDGDGQSDALDVYPLDPAKFKLLPVTPGDKTPPNIMLIEPRDAVGIP